MEDVLAVYTRPYDPRRPQVCLDETSRQLLARGHPAPPGGAGPAGHGRTTSTSAAGCATCSW